MFSFLQCLIMYFVVCGLLTLVCWLLYQDIPWPGYLLIAVPTAAVISYNQGFMTAFLVLAIINCITVLPYIFATLVDIVKLLIPAVIEVIFTIVKYLMSRLNRYGRRYCLGSVYAACSLPQMQCL